MTQQLHIEPYHAGPADTVTMPDFQQRIFETADSWVYVMQPDHGEVVYLSPTAIRAIALHAINREII